MVKSIDVEEKIKAKTYPRLGVARAVVKRASFTRADKARLLELAEKTYKPAEQQSDHEPNKLRSIDFVSAYPPEVTDSRLDQQLLLIAFKLLGLCIEHKLQREEVYKRLEERLKAGMG